MKRQQPLPDDGVHAGVDLMALMAHVFTAFALHLQLEVRQWTVAALHLHAQRASHTSGRHDTGQSKAMGPVLTSDRISAVHEFLLGARRLKQYTRLYA